MESYIDETGKRIWMVDLSKLNDHPDLVRRIVMDVIRNKAKAKMEQEKAAKSG